MDKACDLTCLENKRKCKQRFAFTVAMTSCEFNGYTIFLSGGGELQYGLFENGEWKKKYHTHCFHTKVYFNLFLSPT